MQVVNKKDHKPTDKDIYIGRPSILGNPYSHMVGTRAKYLTATREEAIEKYSLYLNIKVFYERNPKFIEALEAIQEDSILVCWCKPWDCHGDIIIEVKKTYDRLKRIVAKVSEKSVENPQVIENYIFSEFRKILKSVILETCNSETGDLKLN